MRFVPQKFNKLGKKLMKLKNIIKKSIKKHCKKKLIQFSLCQKLLDFQKLWTGFKHNFP